MKTEIVPAWRLLQDINTLFTEYTTMLTENDSSFQEYLAVQRYEEEIKHLEDKYGCPFGRLYLASCDGEAAGCIGLTLIYAAVITKETDSGVTASYNRAFSTRIKNRITGNKMRRRQTTALHRS